jgi:hypothetical protein
MSDRAAAFSSGANTNSAMFISYLESNLNGSTGLAVVGTFSGGLEFFDSV